MGHYSRLTWASRITYTWRSRETHVCQRDFRLPRRQLDQHRYASLQFYPAL